MEVAGVRIAEAAFAEVESKDGRVLVVCGSGNNGGDGLVAARHLFQLGVDVHISIQKPAGRSLSERHLKTATLLGIPVHERLQDVKLSGFDLVIDGLLGTGIKPPLRPEAAEVIGLINEADASVLSIDIPSGIASDSTEGEAHCVQADLTVMLGVAKAGPMQSRKAGRLLLADIGLPDLMLEQAQRDKLHTVYRRGPIVELT
jgi:NAD(P)H-hydrate epimerase